VNTRLSGDRETGHEQNHRQRANRLNASGAAGPRPFATSAGKTKIIPLPIVELTNVRGQAPGIPYGANELFVSLLGVSAGAKRVR